MKSRKAYVRTIGLLCLLLAGAAVFWIYVLIARGGASVLWATIPLALTVLAIRITHDWFYRNGYCSSEQARAFFNACRAEEIRKIKGGPLESLDRIYRETVSDADLGDPEKRLAVYERIYNKGRLNRKDG